LAIENIERHRKMGVGSAGTVKDANVPPQNDSGVSPEPVEKFKEALKHSTTSSNASGLQYSKGKDNSQPSQDTSKSHPIILARRPPIPAHKPPQNLTCTSPTAQQKAGAFVDPALRDVASGKMELAKNAKGPAVQKMQEALQMAGYKLPRFGADGKFGDESVQALKKFQTDHCLKDTGRLDKQTMEQLSIASTKVQQPVQNAPAANTATQPAAQGAGQSPAPDPNALVQAQSQSILAKAQAETPPLKALQALSGGLATAPQAVRDAVLQSKGAQQIIHDAAAWANEPLTEKLDDPTSPLLPEKRALARLEEATKCDKALAGAVALEAVPGYEQFQANLQSSWGAIGRDGMASLARVADQIGGSAKGDAAISRFADMDLWNRDGVRDATKAGAKGTYAVGLASQAQGAMDTQFALDARDAVTGPIKAKVDGDVRALAEHSAELAKIVQNNHKGLTAAQLSAAIDDYGNRKGAAWKADDARLRQQLIDDGKELVSRLEDLKQRLPAKDFDHALALIKDSSADLAISTALKNDSEWAKSDVKAKAIVDLFTYGKLGDIGRKYTGEYASAMLRRKVLEKIQDVNIFEAGGATKMKEAIHSIATETYAKAIGVSKGDLDKAIKAVDGFVDDMAASTSKNADNLVQANTVALKKLDEGLEQIAKDKLDDKIANDASVLKAFSKSTFAGQALRGLSVGLSGLALINSGLKFADKKDWQSGAKAFVDAVGFMQKNGELLVGLGAINKTSTLGKIASEGKLLRNAGAAELISGVSAALDLISAVRSFAGLGVEQDIGAGIISLTSAVGSGVSLVPAFGGAAFWGPVGLGIAAAGVVGNVLYQGRKQAHALEGPTEQFLKAAGYHDAAAEALSKQVNYRPLRDASGSAQMPFLAKYAELKHIGAADLQKWVNKLTPDQVDHLGDRLRDVANEADGDPDKFAADHIKGFEHDLTKDHVPLP
jgi:peptidoglycan hydrolase-like protein with peptidoglycan-binding domain